MNEMNRIAYVLVLILAIFLILMGGIFMIASGIENIVTGVAMLGVAAILFFFLYRSERIEASRPRLISQTFNVKMGGLRPAGAETADLPLMRRSPGGQGPQGGSRGSGGHLPVLWQRLRARGGA